MEEITPKIDWKTAYQDILNARAEKKSPNDISVARLNSIMANMGHMRSLLSQEDQFVPPTVHDLTEEDVGSLLSVPSQMYQIEYPASHYLRYYRTAMQKILVAALESLPEFFSQLEAKQKESIIDWKMQTPTEEELFTEAYAYILNMAQSPYMYPFQDFNKFVKRFVEDEKLREKISRIHSEYSVHFRSNAKKATG